MTDTIQNQDDKRRCSWCAATPDYIHYHDTEWGFPVDDDYRLFEKICLESFQSGLSWRTILAKREHFREAFYDFDFNKISQFKENDVEKLLTNKGIIRHRGKIEATINNAKRAQEMVKEEGSLTAFFWRYEPSQTQLTKPNTASTSPESIALSKELKNEVGNL